MNPPACPPWCAGHYAAGDGTRVHESRSVAVTGESAVDGEPVIVSAWLELRGEVGQAETVAVLEKKNSDDVELCPCDLRRLARWFVTLAEKIEAGSLR